MGDEGDDTRDDALGLMAIRRTRATTVDQVDDRESGTALGGQRSRPEAAGYARFAISRQTGDDRRYSFRTPSPERQSAGEETRESGRRHSGKSPTPPTRRATSGKDGAPCFFRWPGRLSP